jgi:hypothetical protein
MCNRKVLVALTHSQSIGSRERGDNTRQYQLEERGRPQSGTMMRELLGSAVRESQCRDEYLSLEGYHQVTPSSGLRILRR